MLGKRPARDDGSWVQDTHDILLAQIRPTLRFDIVQRVLMYNVSLLPSYMYMYMYIYTCYVLRGTCYVFHVTCYVLGCYVLRVTWYMYEVRVMCHVLTYMSM